MFVIPATDYRPTADAGPNVIISLPQKSVTLYGNSSTDDKKIVSYEWTRTSDDKLAVDMVVSLSVCFISSFSQCSRLLIANLAFDTSVRNLII